MIRLPPTKPRLVLVLCSGLDSSFTIPQAATNSETSWQARARVTLPFHNRDLKRRTLESILDQAGLTHDEFLRLL